MKQKGKQNWRVWRRVVAWLLTLVMVIGLTNGLTLPAQAAGTTAFAVTLDTTTGALKEIKYTPGDAVLAAGQTAYLILWDPKDTSDAGYPRVLASESYTASTSSVVLQCGAFSEFGKSYRIAQYVVSNNPTENILSAKSDWPKLENIEMSSQEDFFDGSSYSVHVNGESTSTGFYIGDALAPQKFVYSDSGSIHAEYDGTTSHTITPTVTYPSIGVTTKYRNEFGEFVMDSPKECIDAGTYTVAYQLSKPGFITETVERTIKIDPKPETISFEQDYYSLTVGASSFTNTLNNPSGASVVYSSSNVAVATVDASGLVTIRGAGTATITAKVVENSNYAFEPDEASFYLVVRKTDAQFYFEHPLMKVYLDNPTVEVNRLMRSPTEVVESAFVTYTSDHPEIAFVNEGTGAVELYGEGREGVVTITATVQQSDIYNYQPETTSYILAVSKKPISVRLEESGIVSGKPMISTDPLYINKVFYTELGQTERETNPGDGKLTYESSN